MTPSPEPMCTHRPGALRREDAGRARGAHLDVAIMRPLMTIHTLHGCTFPLHEVNPEERFESHRIIDVRVMRRQVHPPDDEQTIYLQRDRRQSTRDQPCTANSSGAILRPSRSCTTACCISKPRSGNQPRPCAFAAHPR